MGVLNGMFKWTEQGSYISGFRVGTTAETGLCVAHLLFAYETILFCDSNA